MDGFGNIVVSGAVEGLLDEAVLRRLAGGAGLRVASVHGKNGKADLLASLRGYNQAARFNPWIVLIDLNHSADCPPPALRIWLPDPGPRMCFRVAVRAVEAWLMADRDRLAGFLSVAKSRIPSNPERLDDPKQAMVKIAASSRRRGIRHDMAPPKDSGRRTGPAYTSRLIEFVNDFQNGWRPEEAAQVSDSLRRCLRAVVRLGRAR